jgi:4-hydroxyphenylpyruvate dioxygenase-like putative hemolysin
MTPRGFSVSGTVSHTVVDSAICELFAVPVEVRNTHEGDAGILAVDHTSDIVYPENFDVWANFYRDTFWVRGEVVS